MTLTDRRARPAAPSAVRHRWLGLGLIAFGPALYAAYMLVLPSSNLVP